MAKKENSNDAPPPFKAVPVEPAVSKRGRGRGSDKYRQRFDELAHDLAEAYDSGEAKCALRVTIPQGDFDGDASYSRGDKAGQKKSAEDMVKQRHLNFAGRVRTALRRLSKRRERSGKDALGLGAKPVGDYEIELRAKEFTSRKRKAVAAADHSDE